MKSLNLLVDGNLVQPGSKSDTEFVLSHVEQFDFPLLVEATGYNFETSVPVTADQFAAEFGRLKEKLIAALPGVEQEVILPGLLPPTQHQGLGLGGHLIHTYVKAVERGYKAAYPGRRFHGPGDLTNRVTVCENSGHSRFLDRSGWTIFAYIADIMRCWPVTVERNPQVELIQAGFSVAGGYDGLSILALHPTVLASGYSCPGIDYSGVQVDNGDGSLCAWADYDDIDVCVFEYVRASSGYYSGALSFLG